MLYQLINRQFSFKISDGTLETMKWLALIAMTIDHINTFIFHGTVPLLADIGRLAFPLFIFAFTYNLSREGALSRSAITKVTSKLLIIGAITTPAYYYLTCNAFPGGCSPTNLNVMFTFFVAALSVYLLNLNKNFSFLAFLFMAIFSELYLGYGVVGMILALASYVFIKTPSIKTLTFLLMSVFSLFLANGSHCALLALPIILAAPFIKINLPRIKNIFYYYYAGHLYAIALSVLISPIFL